MNNPFFQLITAFAVLVTLGFIALEGKNVGQSLGLIEEDEPVLVFEIPNLVQYAKVRSMVAPERIISEAEQGVALTGERVYVTDVEHAGGLIAKAGWVDKPIQLVGLGMDVESQDEDGVEVESGPSDEERLTRLRKLVHKPTLTRGEQMFVLRAMNDGLEI